MEGFATNVNTGRLISKSTALYKRLKKLGQTTEIAPATPTPAPTPTVPVPTPTPLREKVIEAATDLIAENKKQFTGISQQDSDDLLRKLLYEKLCITPKTHKPPPSKPSKPSKKKKKYVVESSSVESASDSD